MCRLTSDKFVAIVEGMTNPLMTRRHDFVIPENYQHFVLSGLLNEEKLAKTGVSNYFHNKSHDFIIFYL